MVNTVAWGLLNDRVVDPNNKNLVLSNELIKVELPP